MSKSQIMMDIYTHGFVRDDAALFLDTHPECDEALQLYKDSLTQYEEAVKLAAAEDMPMFQALSISGCSCSDDGTWSWINEPWPWEGGKF